MIVLVSKDIKCKKWQSNNLHKIRVSCTNIRVANLKKKKTFLLRQTLKIKIDN